MDKMTESELEVRRESVCVCVSLSQVEYREDVESRQDIIYSLCCANKMTEIGKLKMTGKKGDRHSHRQKC